MFSIIFQGSREIFHVISVVFQASTGMKLLGKNHGKNPGNRKFDAKHSVMGGSALLNELDPES